MVFGGKYNITKNGRPWAVASGLCAIGLIVAAIDSPALAQNRPLASGEDIATAADFSAFSQSAENGTLVVTAQDNPFNALVGGKRKPRKRFQRGQVTRYVIPDDDRAFLFQDMGDEGLLRFQCAEDDLRFECRIAPSGLASEIFRVQPIRAPRGDIVYKTAGGKTLLRIASYGGATVWWPGLDTGEVVARSITNVSAIEPAPMTRAAVQERAMRAMTLLRTMTGHSLAFEVIDPPTEPGELAVLGEAIALAAKGIAMVADDPIGARVVADRLDFVTLTQGAAADVRLNERSLQIWYNPRIGVNGRVPSAEIFDYLEKNL